MPYVDTAPEMVRAVEAVELKTVSLFTSTYWKVFPGFKFEASRQQFHSLRENLGRALVIHAGGAIDDR